MRNRALEQIIKVGDLLYRAQAEVCELEAQRDELVALVEQVEWVGGFCPWCDASGRASPKHYGDCPRQAALASRETSPRRDPHS